MAEMELRPVTTDPADTQFLSEMLALAAGWRSEAIPPSTDELLVDRHLAVYVEGWGRDGDFGVVAEASGRRTGAAWARSFTLERHGYGFVDSMTPELSIAIVEEARGQGQGTALLKALVALAQEKGVPALSLSGEVDNPAIELYRRVGFREVANENNAATRLLALRRSGDG
jgi:ribosomal protein S18 acetylase RimI-like enzyme